MNFDRVSFLHHAEQLLPRLYHDTLMPQAVVVPVADSAAFQRLRMETAGSADTLPQRTFRNGDRICLDFGETAVGKIRFSLDTVSGYADSPVRLRLVAGEFPIEVAENPDTFHGALSRAWIQDEVVNIDVLPCSYTLPRRYSLRYLLIEVVAAPGELRIPKCTLMTESAVPAPVSAATPIDRACLRTLRNCMQTVFEDGPKRDRRLWTGDLRLQALVNAISFRHDSLVARSLLLLAGCASDDGLIPGCAFEQPKPLPGCNVLDYALIFSVVLQEHCVASGDFALGRELYAAARKQFDFFRRDLHDGCFRAGKETPWVFIDHDPALQRDAAMQCVAIWSLRHLAELADLLEEADDARAFRAEADGWAAAARLRWFDPAARWMVCGEQRQVSYASQIWAVLAGVLSPAEGRSALARVAAAPDALKPVSPYLFHYYGEAMLTAGTPGAEIRDFVQSYWGAMIAKGADTFWEVYKEDDDFYSPYGDARLNSACHAWSGSAIWLLARLGK